MSKTFRTATALASLLLLIGAGCDLSTKISFQNPFKFNDAADVDSASSSLAVRREKGLGIALRPSFLGLTGTFSDLVGDGGERLVAVESADDSHTVVSWKETKDDKEISGSVRADGYVSAHEMFLPAFWKEGEMTVASNGLLWLSKDAYRELVDDEKTEWRLGLGGEKTISGAQAALNAFNTASNKIFGSATTSPAASPFTVTYKGTSEAFPIRKNGKSEPFKVVLASSWFAEYVILANPENPLILKVSINPVSLTALDALSKLGVDPKAVGYEIVEITSP